MHYNASTGFDLQATGADGTRLTLCFGANQLGVWDAEAQKMLWKVSF
ncbi:MAG: hypothetical protein HFJ75_10545 [Eggerthellaceae bacterium]|nr:hypothetical protein [Eggerthellaceae bacterium]